MLLAAFGIGLKLFAAYMMTASPLPANPRVLLAVFLGIIVASFLFPRQIENLGGRFLDKVLFRFIDPKGTKGDRS